MEAAQREMTVEERMQRKKDYMAQIQPYIEHRAQLRALQSFCLVENNNDGFEVVIKWGPGMLELDNMLVELINQVGESFK
jgi:hypothetical protein